MVSAGLCFYNLGSEKAQLGMSPIRPFHPPFTASPLSPALAGTKGHSPGPSEREAADGFQKREGPNRALLSLL